MPRERAIADARLFLLALRRRFPAIQLGPGAWVMAGLVAWTFFIVESTAGEREQAQAVLAALRNRDAA